MMVSGFGGFATESTVRADRVEVPAPLFDDDFDHLECIENFTVQ